MDESKESAASRPTNSAPTIETLTGLERELLSYVERLASASENSARQFRTLEQRSTGLLTQRIDALELGVRSLIASLASLTETLSAFASASRPSRTGCAL